MHLHRKEKRQNFLSNMQACGVWERAEAEKRGMYGSREIRIAQ